MSRDNSEAAFMAQVSPDVAALNPGVFGKHHEGRASSKANDMDSTIETARTNKYRAVRTWSELCQRTFDSKGEAKRAEALTMMERAGQITGLNFQVPFTLCQEPTISVTVDFAYCQDGKQVYEDFKGMMTRDSRTKYAWLREKHGVIIKVLQGGRA